jgi:hypothetical protein
MVGDVTPKEGAKETILLKDLNGVVKYLYWVRFEWCCKRFILGNGILNHSLVDLLF